MLCAIKEDILHENILHAHRRVSLPFQNGVYILKTGWCLFYYIVRYTAVCVHSKATCTSRIITKYFKPSAQFPNELAIN